MAYSKIFIKKHKIFLQENTFENGEHFVQISMC